MFLVFLILIAPPSKPPRTKIIKMEDNIWAYSMIRNFDPRARSESHGAGSSDNCGSSNCGSSNCKSFCKSFVEPFEALYYESKETSIFNANGKVFYDAILGKYVTFKS